MTIVEEANALAECLKRAAEARRARGLRVPAPQGLDGDAGGFELMTAFPWRGRGAATARPLPEIGRRACAVDELTALDGVDLIRAAYRAVLAREPEPAVLHRLLVELEAGQPKAFFIGRLRGSAEGRSVGTRVAGLMRAAAAAFVGALRREGPGPMVRSAASRAAWTWKKLADRGLLPSRTKAREETDWSVAVPAAPEAPAPPRMLSVCITTYNRAAWLSHSLPRLIEQARPFGEFVEVLVCDNASTDATPEVIAPFLGARHVRYHRNERNVGMLGNLGVCGEKAAGRYVWILGDDDLVIDGAIDRILWAIQRHPGSELFYLNYAYTEFSRPESLTDAEELIRGAHPVSPAFRDEAVPEVRRIAARSENCFTGIYSMVFRADHARQAYRPAAAGEPFRSLPQCVPTADYVVRRLFRRPGCWIGDPCAVVNMNVSWTRYASLFILERFPELFDIMQENGADPVELDEMRTQHVPRAMRWLAQIFIGRQRENLAGFSIERLFRRFRHLPAFRRQWGAFAPFYRALYVARMAGPGAVAPARLEALLSSSRCGTNGPCAGGQKAHEEGWERRI